MWIVLLAAILLRPQAIPTCIYQSTGGHVVTVSNITALVIQRYCSNVFNPLMPNDHYTSRTAPLTSKRCILCIYSTNMCTEYIKYGINSPFFLFKMQFVS